MSDTLARHDDPATLPRTRPTENDRQRSATFRPVGWERDTDQANPAGWLSLDE